MKYNLRPATAEDIDWLDPFYEKIMRPYVELTHEWNPTVFREKFKPSNSQIIQVDEEDAGLLKHEILEGHIFLWDIQLAEQHQGSGIGTDILLNLQAEAVKLGLPIRLRVLKGNPALQFYQRHGFGILEELDNCFEMEWNIPAV